LLSPIATQITDFLYLGSENDAYSGKFLAEKQIGYIMNVAGEVRSVEHKEVKHVRIIVEDMVDDHQHHTFEEAFKVIDNAVNEKRPVLIHCARGRSRSATIVIGYLMTRNNWTLREAYSHVKERRPIIGPHSHLQDQLLTFEVHLSGTNTMQKADFYGRNRYSPYG